MTRLVWRLVIYQKKRQRIDAWHADRREEASLKSKIMLQPVAAENAFWKCPKYDLGFTFEQRQKFKVQSLAAVRNRRKPRPTLERAKQVFRFVPVQVQWPVVQGRQWRLATGRLHQ